MKRKLALFLAFIMILGILPTNAFAATDAAKLAAKNDKTYEEVIIDGAPYKVYKVADFLDKPSQERPLSLMSRSAKPFRGPGTPAQPYDGWKFYLKLTWETIDRPIDNATIPVYFGPPDDSRAIKLGHFVVTTGADQDQYIEMKEDYSGTNPSIDFLVNQGFSNIVLAVPKDMRYDFILASAKWDDKNREGTKGKDQKVVFTVEGKQSVMHGFGIRWYDTDAANREKIDAKWGGLVGQELDAKLATVDRNYSAYILNKVDRHNPGRLQHYPDGSEYTPFDYYYNGEKITTCADAENQGKFDNNQLAIGSESDRSNARLTVEGKREGSKVLKNNTKYLYNSVGDYRTFHVLSMREALNVKLNSGAGKVNDQANQDLKVGSKATQEIGHSEMIKGNESGREISFTTDETVVAPKVKIAGKDVDATFAGWATKPQKLENNKLVDDPESKVLVDANGDLTNDGKAYTFTTKETILYQVFEAPQEGKVTVKYVDTSGTPILDKYKIQGKDYPTFAEGKKGEDVDASKIPQPKFIGYKRTADAIDVTGKTYKEEDATTKLDVVEVKYEKLPDIIPAKDDNGNDNPDATQDVKDTYKKVTIKVDSTKGKFQKNNADVTGSEFLYYVNPVEGKTLQDVLTKSDLKAKSNDENANKIDAAKPWKFTPDKTKADTPADVALATEVNKDNFKGVDNVVMEVNFGQTTADKFKDKLDPETIKVWVGDTIDWKKGVKVKDDAENRAQLVEDLKEEFKKPKASVTDLGEGGTKDTPKTARNSDDQNLPNGKKGNLLVTFDDGSTLVVNDQMLYVAPVKVKKDGTTDEKKLPDDKIKVDIKLGEGVQVGDTKGDKTNPVVYSSFYLKPGTGLQDDPTGSDFPAVEAQEGYKQDSITWEPSNKTQAWNKDGAYVATAQKQTIAEKVGKGNLAPVDFGVWVKDPIDWKKGVKVADSVTDDDLKTEIQGYLNDAKTEVTDATTPARTSAAAGTFPGKLTVKFSDNSTLTVDKQTLYVWAHKTENNDNNKDDPKPADAVQVSFKNGTGVTALDPENKTMTVKPDTALEDSDFPTATVDEANGYVNPAIWTGKVASLGHKVTAENNVFTATANKGKSEETVIPYEPTDPTKPTDKNDPNIPTEDDKNKTVDKNDYVVVAFKVAPDGSGTLTLGKIVDKAVISALVKKGTDWSKVTLPTTKATDPYAFWYWTAKTGTVAEGDIRTAHFIKSGDEITPNDPALPDGFFKVTVNKGAGVKDNTLFGKSYAVKKGDTLEGDKFPTLEAKDNYRDPKWYKGETVLDNKKPEEVVINENTDFIAKAREVYLTINDATEGDEKITGKVTPGTSEVVVKVNNNDPLTAVPDKDGNWTVDVPKDKPLKVGDEIVATVPNDNLTAKTTVKGKSVTPPYKPTDTEVIGGDDRIDTAGEISKKYYSYADNVVVARKDQFPDALTASVLAKALNAPILLTDTNKLDARTAAEIKRLGAKNIYVIGGESAISAHTAKELMELGRVIRIGGADRFETSALIAKKVVSLVGRTGKAIIATGEKFADSLSVSPYAAKMGYPILLVRQNQVPKVIKQTISNLGIKSVYILGENMAVSYKVNKELPKLIARIGGADRYETSAKIADMFFTNAKEAFMASGQVFADALVIGPVAAMKNVPVLLTQKNVLPKAIKAVIDRCHFEKITIVGLQNAVSKEVIEAINK